MIQLKKTVAAVILGLGFTAFAQAAFIKHLGTLSSTETLYGYNQVSEGAFSDEYSFSVANDLLGVTTTVFSIDLSQAFSLSSLTVFVYKDGDLDPVWSQEGTFQTSHTGSYSMTVNGSFALDPLSSYTIVIQGVADGYMGGAYSLNMSASPVPEPAEYAMLLAGLGVIGMVARRRKIAIN